MSKMNRQHRRLYWETNYTLDQYLNKTDYNAANLRGPYMPCNNYVLDVLKPSSCILVIIKHKI